MKQNFSTSPGPEARLDQNKTVFEVEVMVRAHEKWVAAGRPHGKPDEFWAAAEQEIRKEGLKRIGTVNACH
jgi:hypothetical protein